MSCSSSAYRFQGSVAILVARSCRGRGSRGKSLTHSCMMHSDWDIYASPNAFTTQQRFKRRLGPTEVSYYLGSRGDGGHESGVNDMLVVALPCLGDPMLTDS